MRYLTALLAWVGLSAACFGDITTALDNRFLFNASSGTAVSAATGSMSGTTSGSPAWVAGKNSNCLDYDGTNDFVEMSTNGDTYSSTRTFSFWINPDTVATSVQGLVQKRRGGDNELDTRLSTNKVTLVAWNSGGTAIINCSTSTSIAASAWTHIIATVPGNGNTAKIFINGVSDTLTGTTTQGGTIKDGTDNYTIAEVQDDPARFYNGKLDDLRIYSRALTDADAMELYLAEGGTASGPAWGDKRLIIIGQLLKSRWKRVQYGNHFVWSVR